MSFGDGGGKRPGWRDPAVAVAVVLTVTLAALLLLGKADATMTGTLLAGITVMLGIPITRKESK